MKRRDFIKVTGLGAVGAAAVAAPAIAQSMPEIKWRMPTSWPKSLDTLYGGAEMMAKMVGEATDNKFQIQSFAGGEIVPGLQVLDAVQNGTCEIGHTASYYYFGKDPTFTFGSSVPFGPNMRINQAWYTLGGGKEVLNEFYKKYNVHISAGGQHRLPDGRLVPQGNQYRRRSQGIEIPHRRLCRPCDAEAGLCSAAACRRRHLSGAGEGHHRRGGMGWSLRRREARLLQGRAALLLSRLVGRRSDAVGVRQSRQVERAAEILSKRSRAGRSLRQQLDDGEIRRRPILRRCGGCWRTAPSCTPSRRRSCKRASRRRRNCTAKCRQPMPTSRRSTNR